MDLLWVRVAIGAVSFFLMWRAWGPNDMTPASFYWWISGIALMQLTYLLEGVGLRWRLRQEVKAYLSMDPELREHLLSKVWLSVTRNYLREQLAKEPDVEVSGVAERYPFPSMDKRLSARLYWALTAVAAFLLASALGVVSLGLAMRLVFLAVGVALVVGLAYLRQRERHLATILEVTPFAVAEIHPDGARRVILFNQPLQLRNRPRLGRVELRGTGDDRFIPLDYDRIGFQRALDRVLTFGGFREAAA
jgi:hypothetical protein